MMQSQDSIALPARVSWIDSAKGIAMLLVIYLHSGAELHSSIVFGSFHMPLFFFLSGLFLFKRDTDFYPFLNKKVRSLLIPYLIFGLILASYSTILDIFIRHNDIIPGYRHIGLFVNTRRAPFYGSLWFLLTLFSVEVILWSLHRWIKNDIVRLIVCLLVFCIGGVIVRDYGSLLWSFDLTMVCLIFTELGYIFATYQKLLSEKLIIGLLLPVFIIAAYLNYYYSGASVDLFSCRIGSITLFFLAAVSGTILIIPTAKFFSGIKLLNYIGSNSLLYYCLQFLLLIPFSKIMSVLIPSDFSFSIPFIQTLLIVVSLIPIINFINRKAKWMIGKSPS